MDGLKRGELGGVFVRNLDRIDLQPLILKGFEGGDRFAEPQHPGKALRAAMAEFEADLHER